GHQQHAESDDRQHEGVESAVERGRPPERAQRRDQNCRGKEGDQPPRLTKILREHVSDLGDGTHAAYSRRTVGALCPTNATNVSRSVASRTSICSTGPRLRATCA